MQDGLAWTVPRSSFCPSMLEDSSRVCFHLPDIGSSPKSIRGTGITLIGVLIPKSKLIGTLLLRECAPEM